MAERGGADRPRRKSGTRAKALEIDGVQDHHTSLRVDAECGEALEAIAIHGDVAADPLEQRRNVAVRRTVVTDEDARTAGIREHRFDGLRVVLPVDDVGSPRQLGQVGYDRDGVRLEELRDLARVPDSTTIGRWPRAASPRARSRTNVSVPVRPVKTVFVISTE